MFTKKSNNRALITISFVSLVVMVTQFFPFFPLGEVLAEDFNGKYIDRVTIAVEGVGNFVDADPFDNDMNFKLTVGKDCNSEVKGFKNDPKTETETVDIYLKKMNSTGECIDDREGKLTLTDTDKRWVTAYKVSEDIIFMPAYKVTENKVSELNETRFSISSVRALNGYYKMTPSDRSDHNPDHYIYFDNGKWTDYDNGGGGGRIKFSERIYQIQKCPPIEGCKSDSYNIVFANNGEITKPDTGIYKEFQNSVTGAAGDTEAEAEAEASCESENNKVYSWILCPVLNFVDETILGTGGGEGGADKKGLMGIVDDLLSVDASLYDNDGLKLAWSYFRNIAMAILVLVGLIMIVGTAISKE